MNSIQVYEVEQFNYRGIVKTVYANTISAHLHKYIYAIAANKVNFYFSMLVTHGSGTHDIDFNSYPVKPGYVFFMHPGQIHSWKLSADIEGFIIFHTKEFYNQNFTDEHVERLLFYQVGNLPLLVLNEPAQDKIGVIFQNIVRTYESEQLMQFKKICSLLNVLYIELSQLYIPAKQQINKNEYRHKQIRQLENFIDENYKRLKFPKQYASLMNLSQKHLNRIVKLNLNKTTSTLISERILLEAKRMLIHSDLTISQIALELGYTENGYFFRVFKNKIGETPTEFMNRYRD